MADVTPFPGDRRRSGRSDAHRRRADTATDVHRRADTATDPVADEVLTRLRRALPRPSLWIIGPLVVLSAIQAVLVLPWLVGRDPWQLLSSTTDGHITRDGALGLMVAVTGLLVAWRSRWALPAFLLATLAVVAQAVTGLFDAAEAGAGPSLAGELVHVPSILITCLVGLAAVPLPALGPSVSSSGK